jgi:hypothetical protein
MLAHASMGMATTQRHRPTVSPSTEQDLQIVDIVSRGELGSQSVVWGTAVVTLAGRAETVILNSDVLTKMGIVLVKAARV